MALLKTKKNQAQLPKLVFHHDEAISFMQSMPPDSVDLLFTDPPYNVSRDNNFQTMGRSGIDFGEWDHDFDQITWLSELYRVVKKGGSVLIWNDWKNMGDIAKELDRLGFEVKDLIRWKKLNPMPRNTDRRYVTDYEWCIWAVKKGKWTFNREGDSYLRPEYECAIVPGSKRIHVNEKPVKLLRDILRVHSNIWDTVLDCYMGSASLGEACLLENRNYIGVDNDLEMVGKARHRGEEVKLKLKKKTK